MTEFNPRVPRRPKPADRSRMRVVGVWLVVLSPVCAFVGAAAAGSDNEAAATLFFASTLGGAASVGLTLWVLGAIEDRLIEIRNALIAKDEVDNA